MGKFIDLTGKRFGKYVAISYFGMVNGVSKWNCKCDCGKEKLVCSENLIKGKSKSCGCARSNHRRKNTNLTGMKFGQWTVLREVNRNKRICWECKCSCGTIRVVEYSSLIKGLSKSCGCASIKYTTNIECDSKTRDRLEQIYRGMKSRCYDLTTKGYENYGGRGIIICDEWLGDLGCERFMNWALENGYSNELSIDRVDNNKNYEPSNCRWANKKTQANNRRTSHVITVKGETHTLAEWSEITGINRGTITTRIQLGWDEERLFIPPQNNKGGKNG